MTEYQSTSKAIETYLVLAGWKTQEKGTAGALWRREVPLREPAVVAVPSQITTESNEWRAVVTRIAVYEERSYDLVEFDIVHPNVDVTRFKVANDFVVSDSIPLDAGVDLISTAHRILRASATTAQRGRAQIGGNYSKIGDGIARLARLGHSESGSYVLPVLMPLTIQESDLRGGFWENQTGVLGRVPLEPSERRVTRTVAIALNAIARVVVEPAKEPTSEVVDPLVASGVSKEFVMAVEDVLGNPAIATFETGFSWAHGVTAPSGLPSKIEIPSGARELLTKTASLLRRSSRDPDQRVSGPIVQVRHLPDDPFGEFALQTIRRGRQAEVRVRLNEDKIGQALEWMKTSRMVIVEGQVVRDPGRPLRIDNPGLIYPIDESFLFVDA